MDPTTEQPLPVARELKKSITAITTTPHLCNNLDWFQVETPSTIGRLISLKSESDSLSKNHRRVKNEKPTVKSTISPATNDLPSLKRTADNAFALCPAASLTKTKAENVQVESEVEKVSDSTQTGDTSEIETQIVDTLELETADALSQRPLLIPTSVSFKRKKLVPGEKRNLGGRPRTATLKARKGTGRTTILRKSKPVATEIPLDVWRNILAFCPLDFLVKARSVSRSFYLALNYDSTWREARMRSYGPDCPEPPAHLTEMQYADLLTGHGCQSKSCQEKSRKTYWAFQRRWCEKCLKQRIVMQNSTQALTKEYPELFDCVHHAAFDSWDNYQCVGTYDPIPSWLRIFGIKLGYERSAVASVIEEIEQLRSPDENGNLKSTEEKDAWFVAKAKSSRDFVEKLKSIENWVEVLRRKKLDDGKGTKDIRAAYFEKKAMTMDPPLELAALQKTQSFNRAILITKQPSERSWVLLKKKLDVERHLAERIVNEDIADKKLSIPEWNDMMLISLRKDHFSTLENPDLNALFALVDSVILRLGIADNPSTIADQDFVLLTLKEVHREYYHLEESSRPKGVDGSSRLLLEDARRVYMHKLEPIIKSWDSEPRTKAATKFKCPLCTRRDVNRRWGFTGLMYHIDERHASNNAEFGPWRKRNFIFPWHRIEWPQNLPILADHHTTTGKWSLTDDSDYRQVPRPTIMPTEQHESAFKDRCVSMELGVQGSTNSKFIENILYAASELHTTSLAPEYMTQIVFQFALQKYKLSCDTAPDFDIVEPLQVALLRAGHHTLFEGFRCQWCCEQPEPSKNNRFINKGQPFGDLMRHFSTFYHPRHEWTIRSLNFRSVEELSLALHQPEQNDALQAFNRLFPPFMEGYIDSQVAFGS